MNSCQLEQHRKACAILINRTVEHLRLKNKRDLFLVGALSEGVEGGASVACNQFCKFSTIPDWLEKFCLEILTLKLQIDIPIQDQKARKRR